MTIALASTLLLRLREEYRCGKPSSSKTSTQEELKLLLTKLNLLLPSQLPNEQAISQEFYELSILLALKDKKIDDFNRYYTLSRQFPSSTRTPMIKGLYLLYLLSSNKITEFHVELEQIEDLNNVYINHSILLLNSMIEGSFNKIITFKGQLPAPEYALFMDILSESARLEIAKCLELAYEKLSFQDCKTLLYQNNDTELMKMIKAFGWKYDIASKNVTFSGVEAALGVVGVGVVTDLLGYAQELEQII